ncbi:uncharacterized protein BXZ73DRAFT_105172 [Epithele typhae]|uniref:uncharacterized protein n=1 Tax=Epithele typhae TaxID=378194 RepID=UPI0020077DBC|nr:uncharacterized protein BXZ73DRAFT_105172 [Epithele typhae]KAH9918532.1 hypothetical protein BXZ73DRAFT_105172 [Epithele typhae]
MEEGRRRVGSWSTTFVIPIVSASLPVSSFPRSSPDPTAKNTCQSFPKKYDKHASYRFSLAFRACVCISSQLYDRRALDTNSSLPLSNSLTHLMAFSNASSVSSATSASLLHLRRTRPPFMVLLHSHPPKPAPILLPKTYYKHAGCDFSLAFQCIANIGFRSSEPIRSRVVEAGTLEVVGRILEAWLASKGFAQALERQVSEQPEARVVEPSGRDSDVSHEEPMQTKAAQPPAGSSRVQAAQEKDNSTETSTNATPNRSTIPTGSVVVPGRDRSGTILAQPVAVEEGGAAGHSSQGGKSRMARGVGKSRRDSEGEDEDGDENSDEDSDEDGDEDSDKDSDEDSDEDDGGGQEDGGDGDGEDGGNSDSDGDGDGDTGSWASNTGRAISPAPPLAEGPAHTDLCSRSSLSSLTGSSRSAQLGLNRHASGDSSEIDPPASPPPTSPESTPQPPAPTSHPVAAVPHITFTRSGRPTRHPSRLNRV